MKRALYIFTLALFMAFGAELHAQVDEFALALRDKRPHGIRWENVESSRLWRSGKMPRYDFNSGKHQIHLRAGEDTVFYLPAYSMARIGTRDSTTLETLRVSLSRGDGLFRPVQVERIEELNALVVNPLEATPKLLRVRVPTRSEASHTISLFVSREVRSTPFLPYFEELMPQGSDRVKLTQTDKAGHEWFSVLNPKKPIKFKVKGPARLMLETRLLYPKTESRNYQDYRLTVSLNENILEKFELVTAVEFRRQFYVSDEERSVGRKRELYLLVPEGEHEVSAETDLSVLLRVRKLATSHAQIPEGEAQELFSGWQDEEHDRPSKLRGSVAELYRSHTLGLARGRFNGERESGLLALATQKTLFQAYPAWPEFDDLARAYRFHRTFYRELTPEVSEGTLTFRHGSFDSPALKGLGEDDGKLYLAAAHVEDHTLLLSAGVFAGLPSGEPSSLRYSLPERYSESTLRLALLDRTEAARGTLWVQYNNEPPLELTLAQEHRRPTKEFKPPLAAGILKGDIVSTTSPSFLVHPSVAELTLPSHVKTVRVWFENTGEYVARPFVALHYRASREYALSESQFQALKERLPAHQNLYTIFEELLDGDISHLKLDGSPASELKNHFIPFVLYQRANQMTYAQGLSCKEDGQDQSQVGSCSQEIERARELIARDPLASVALWQRLSSSSKLACRSHALQARTEELLKQKEFFLAESLLREDLLTSCDRETQKVALSELKRFYSEHPDSGTLSDVLSALVAIHPSNELLLELGKVLFEEGDYTQSLQAFLLAGEEKAPGELLLEAALRSGWYGLLHQVLREQPDRGISLRSYFHEATRLREKLQGNLQERVRALYTLEQFPQHRPEEERFVLSPELFSSSPGGVLVYATQRNQYGRYFTVKKDAPATLEVLGPVTLRLEFRPLHKAGDSTDYDSRVSDLITLTGSFGERRVVLSDNSVSPGLTLVGSHDAVGMAKHYQLRLGPGLHQLSVSSREAPFLIRAYSTHTNDTLGILPSLSKEYVRAMLCEDDTAGQPSWMKVPAYLSQPESDGIWLASGTPNRSDCIPALNRLDPIDRLRIELRLGEISHESKRRKEQFLAREDIEAEEKQLFLFYLGERSHLADAGGITKAETLAASIFENLEVSLPAFAQFEEIYAKSSSPLLESLRRSFLKRYNWQAIESVNESAGVRLLEFETLGAESPEGRLREGLFTPLSPQESRLSYRSNIIVSVNNSGEKATELLISQEELGMPEKRAVTLFYSVDDEEPQSLTLRPEKTELLRITLGAGKHFVRLWCPELSPTTFVRVRNNSSDSNQAPQMKRRRYYVATMNDPLRYTFSGPKIIRVDKITDGIHKSEQRIFGPGAHELALTPPSQGSESLIRLFERVPVRDEVKSANLKVTRLSEVIPSPPEADETLSFSQFFEEDTTLVDELSLGGQEDGTWSFRFGAVRRRIFEEAVNQTVEQFLEIGSTYRFFDDTRNLYSTTDLFFRPHEDHSPSFGAEQYFDYTPRDSSWSFAGKGYGYGQMASEDLGESSRGPEWHVGGFVTIQKRYDLHLRTSHAPSISLFGRELSQGVDTRFISGSLDQDVFTDYKADHRYGLRVGESVTYELNPASQALVQARLNSNEDFNIFSPDSASLRVGANTMFNLLESGLYYRLNHFIDDSDRGNSSTRHAVAAEFDLRSWEIAPDRLGLRADLRYDFDTDELSAALFFEFDHSEGRVLNDFRPGDVRYRRIREHVAGIHHPRNRRTLEEQ